MRHVRRKETAYHCGKQNRRENEKAITLNSSNILILSVLSDLHLLAGFTKSSLLFLAKTNKNKV